MGMFKHSAEAQIVNEKSCCIYVFCNEKLTYFQHILSRKELYPEFIKNCYKLIKKRPSRKIKK